MQKLITLERPTYQPMYRTQQTSDPSRISSPRSPRLMLLHDAPNETEVSWESFDANSVTAYFSRGINLLHKNIAQLQDRLQSYSEQDEKDLLFMAESLIQARRLIEEVRVPSK